MNRLLRSFVKSRRGVALIEFAFVLPVMVLLFLGTFEASRAVRAKMKASNAAQSIADLIAAQNSVSTTDMANYCQGAKMVMLPFPGAPLKAAVASVTNGARDWHDETCGSATAIASPTSIATSLSNGSGNSVIIVQTSYTYSSFLAYVLPASITMTQTAFGRPRNIDTVACATCQQN
jgi:Flp pilus assembly protein TadG